MRLILGVAITAALLRAQEDVADEWNPREIESVSDWQVLAGAALTAFALYGYWRVARWFIDHRCNRPHWKALRYWWPTSMVVLAGLAVLLDEVQRSRFGDGLYDIVAGVAGFLNIPAAPLAFLVAPLMGVLHLSGLASAAVIAPFLWLFWYGIIRFLEWRSICAAPISLRDNW